MKRRVIFLCNALDDVLRAERGIETDSPAGSRKVFMTMAVLRGAGLASGVISLGRGRASGIGRAFPARRRRIAGTPVLYLPFTHRRLLSELGSLASAALAVAGLRTRGRDTALLVYNRAPAFVPAVIVARLRGIRLILDLEDDDDRGRGRVAALAANVYHGIFDRLIGGSALVACTMLSARTALRPTLPYYGIARAEPGTALTRPGPLIVLLGGSVDPATGGDLLADAIERLRRDAPGWAGDIEFRVSGKGSSIPRLKALGNGNAVPLLRVLGRLSDDEYATLRRETDVGLSLKLHHGPLAETTFPSKTIEMASAGQLVITTDISDVRRVLGDDGALYLADDLVDGLLACLEWAVANRVAARRTAERGQEAAARRCAPESTGRALAEFLFP